MDITMTFEQALELLESGTYGEDVRKAIYNGLYRAYNDGGGGGGGGGSLEPNSVDTIHLKNDAVKTAKINNGAVTEAKLASDLATKINNPLDQISSIPQSKLGENSVGNEQLKQNSVYGNVITPGAIEASHISGGAVTREKIDSLAVSTEKIADSAVTTNKLSADLQDVLSESANRILAFGTNGAHSEVLISDDDPVTIGQIQIPTTKRVLKYVKNVRTFGAKGDGQTNDSTAIQAAFYACRDAGGGVVYFPAGTYIIGGVEQSGSSVDDDYYFKYVEFFSNTHIVGVPGATVLKYDSSLADDGATGKSPQSLLRNHTNNSQGGYSATHDVTIDGITFDGNESIMKKSTHLGIGHAENIVVRNCVFKNKKGNTTSTHYLEFNAVKNGVIDGCSFFPSWHYAMDRDNAGAATNEQQRVYGEYINIDIARSGAYGTSSYYNYDGAECDGVEIRNCYFESYPSNAFATYTKQPYIPYAIGGHYADETHGWFETSKNVHIYNNYFLGDWNVGRINGSSASLPSRRYTINANYMTGSVDFWSIHDNVFKAINTGTHSSENKLPCGINLNTTGTHNFIYNNTFINYDAGELLYHGSGAPTSQSAQYWNNVNIATDGTVTIKEHLSATPIE